MTKTKKRIEWLDSLCTLAVASVMLIPISMPIVNTTFGKEMNFWWIGHILNSSVRFAIPMFLMVSGAVLFSRKHNLKDFYKKYFVRFLLPFLFFMLVYWVSGWFNLPEESRPRGIIKTLGWGADLFLKKGISEHFWFIYILLFLYLVVPFASVFVQKLKSEMIVFLLAAWVLLAVISCNFPVNLFRWSTENMLQRLYIYVLYMGYMVLGYYLYNIFYVSRNIRLTAAILYIITTIATVLVVYYTSRAKSELDLAPYNYLSLNTIIQSAAVFISLKQTKIKTGWLKQLAASISNRCYGIYLVHILVINIFFNHGFSWTMAHPLISLPVLLILTLGTSLAIVFLLRKIPYGKYIAG